MEKQSHNEGTEATAGGKRKEPPLQDDQLSFKREIVEAKVNNESESSLTEHDERKLAEKRAYNRRNAARARQRVKDQLAELNIKVENFANRNAEVEDQNKKLLAQVKALTEENQTLRRYIVQLANEQHQNPANTAPLGPVVGSTSTTSSPASLLYALQMLQGQGGVSGGPRRENERKEDIQIPSLRLDLGRDFSTEPSLQQVAQIAGATQSPGTRSALNLPSQTDDQISQAMLAHILATQQRPASSGAAASATSAAQGLNLATILQGRQQVANSSANFPAQSQGSLQTNDSSGSIDPRAQLLLALMRHSNPSDPSGGWQT